MVVILICGAPGTGKTTLTYKLADRLKSDHIIQSDTLKDFFKMGGHCKIARDSTHNCWKYFGEKSRENIIKGFEEHVKHYTEFIDKMIRKESEKFKTIIAEGAQVTPKLFSSLEGIEKVGFLLTLEDEKEQFRRYKEKNKQRKIKNEQWFENYEAIRIIDSYLRKQAKQLDSENFHVLNDISLEEILGRINKKSKKLEVNYGF